MHNVMKFLFLPMLILMAMGCQPENKSGWDARMYKAFREEVDTYLSVEGYNGSIAITEQGEILYQAAFGLRDLQTGDSMRVSTPFYLASVAKQITAMSILMLSERKVLSLDDSVSKYFPELPYGDSVQVRHLLTHTSGIPDYYDMGVFEWGMTNDRVYQALLDRPRLDFSPGSAYDYSNSAYVLLSMIVAKASGVSYREFIRQEIFDPLDMKQSEVYDETRPEILNRAIGFDSARQGLDYDAYTTGGGGIFSNVTDMIKWERALYTDQFVSASTLREAYQPFQLSDGKLSYYGFGWRIDPEDPNHVFHSGSLVGFRTYMDRQLDQKRMILLLTNNSNENLEEIVEHLRSMVDGTRK